MIDRYNFVCQNKDLFVNVVIGVPPPPPQSRKLVLSPFSNGFGVWYIIWDHLTKEKCLLSGIARTIIPPHPSHPNSKQTNNSIRASNFFNRSDQVVYRAGKPSLTLILPRSRKCRLIRLKHHDKQVSALVFLKYVWNGWDMKMKSVWQCIKCRTYVCMKEIVKIGK